MVKYIDFPIISLYIEHLVVCVLYSKDNRFQLKLGTFAQNKSSSTQLVENWLANWQSQILSSQLAIVVVTMCDIIQKEVKSAWHKHFRVKKLDPL